MNELPRRLFGSRTAAISYAGLLLVVVLATYGPVFDYPYIQDDYAGVDFVRMHHGLDALQRIFDPGEHFFYRPLSTCYYFVVVRTFGLRAAGFHAGSMLLLALGAWMAARVIHEITGDRLVALGTGVLYAAASPIHMDTMTWMVGTNDLGAMLAALVTLHLFLRGRHAAAGAALLAGLLFKEAGLFVPLLLLVCGACGGARWTWRKAALSSLPYGAALLLFLVPKLVAHSLVALPDAHPYAVRLVGGHLLLNAYRFVRWFVDALFPMFTETGWSVRPIVDALHQPALRLAGGAALLLVTALALVGAVRLARRRREAGLRFPPPSVLILTAWIPLGLLPVVFLPNHAYRHYLTYSLPPLLALFLLFLKAGAERLGRRPRLAGVAVGLWIAISLPFSVAFFHRRASEGLEERYVGGTSLLFRQGALARLVRSGLDERRASLPRGSMLVFQGIPISAFLGDYGVRVWLDDPTARAFEAGDVAHDGRGLFVEDGLNVTGRTGPRRPRGRLDLDPARTFVFLVRGGALHDITGEFLAARGVQGKKAVP